MRTPNEIIHKEMNSIEFTMFDDVMNKTAKKIVDSWIFFSGSPEERSNIRSQINRELNRTLDREARKLNEPNRFITLQDKITSDEAWRAMIPHESPAEVPPVPTFKEVLDYIYKYCLQK